jgi:hypothetical protein
VITLVVPHVFRACAQGHALAYLQSRRACVPRRLIRSWPVETASTTAVDIVVAASALAEQRTHATSSIAVIQRCA